MQKMNDVNEPRSVAFLFYAVYLCIYIYLVGFFNNVQTV